MPLKTLITVDEFLEMSHETPVELVRGEIVEMGSPGARHGFVCVRVAVVLSRWADELRAGYVIGNDSGIVTKRDPDTIRGADCQFISSKRLPQGLPKKGYATVPPDLAVEVVSDSDRWSEVMKKVDEYLDAGVAEVWVVDPQDESVDVLRMDRRPKRFGRDAELTSEALPGFSCKVVEFFLPG